MMGLRCSVLGVIVAILLVWNSGLWAQAPAADQTRSITVVQVDGQTKEITFSLPKLQVKVSPRSDSKSSEQTYFDWAGEGDSFFLTLATEIKSVLERMGSDATLELLKNYVDFGLRNVNLSAGLKAVSTREGVSIGSILRVQLKAHENAKGAIAFVNTNLKRMNVPIEYVHAIDNQLPDPFVPRAEEKGLVNYWEKARYIAGPGVIALGVATGQTTLDTPLVTTSGVQTAYEIQFANKWMNRKVWTPIFDFTGKVRHWMLGINPGILAINMLYPASLYEIRHALVNHYQTDPSVLASRPEAYTLFALGALIFTASYGKIQDDLIVQRDTGRISEAMRYVRESMVNITANALRVATIFVPVVLWKFHVGPATYQVDLGTIGLVGLGLFVATPNAIKTLVGPRVRSAYIRNGLEAPTGAFKTCLRALDRVANPFRLTIRSSTLN